MRGRTVAERINDAGKPGIYLLFRHAQYPEHPFLHAGIVYPYGPPANFSAIQHEVICVGIHLFQVTGIVAVELIKVLRLGGCEWMVFGIETLCFLVPFQ